MGNPKRARSWKRRIQPRVGLKAVEPVLYSTHALSDGGRKQRCLERKKERASFLRVWPSAISQPKAQNNPTLKSHGGPHRAAVFLSNDLLDATH